MHDNQITVMLKASHLPMATAFVHVSPTRMTIPSSLREITEPTRQLELWALGGPNSSHPPQNSLAL